MSLSISSSCRRWTKKFGFGAGLVLTMTFRPSEACLTLCRAPYTVPAVMDSLVQDANFDVDRPIVYSFHASPTYLQLACTCGCHLIRLAMLEYLSISLVLASLIVDGTSLASIEPFRKVCHQPSLEDTEDLYFLKNWPGTILSSLPSS